MIKKQQGKPWLAPCDRPARHWQGYRGQRPSPPAPADQREALRQAPSLRSISKPPREFNADPISGERSVALQTGSQKPIISISLIGTVTAGTKTESNVGSVAVYDLPPLPCSTVEEPAVQAQVRDLLDDDEIESLGEVIDKQRMEIGALKALIEKNESKALFWESRARTLTADARSKADEQENERADLKTQISTLQDQLRVRTRRNAASEAPAQRPVSAMEHKARGDESHQAIEPSPPEQSIEGVTGHEESDVERLAREFAASQQTENASKPQCSSVDANDSTKQNLYSHESNASRIRPRLLTPV